ncbi:MAG: 4-alpha-glucanotransferase [Planctomycetaceae bacterium]|nr:MAG: 4-alpha-glucanotransferase [Planctomycetaceae bacterium]
MSREPLSTLARLYGVRSTYVDVWQRHQRSPDESVLRILQLLGAPVNSIDDAPVAVRFRRQEIWQQWIQPVLVAFEGCKTAARLQLPESMQDANYQWQIEREDGQTITRSGRVADLPILRRRSIEGVTYTRRSIDLPEGLPWGYHRLRLEVGDRSCESLVIAAPLHAYDESCDDRQKIWGVFLPLYALHRQSNRRSGDFSDLEALMQWTATRGGRLVATLPLLSTLWELTDDPSPYNPASRLFWNEFYVCPEQTPEFPACTSARQLWSHSPASGATPPSPLPGLIDYSAEMQRKRRVLEALAAEFFQQDSTRRAELSAHCIDNPELERFARFRAVGERQGIGWPAWPERLRDGTIAEGDYDPSVFRYHLYTQWQVDRQLDALKDRADRLQLLWYLDFPLGVNGGGYDVWRERDIFVREASGGAPPDSFFTKGQDWGFPPLHPGQLRQQGYTYFIRALRNHLQHARVLRFDHVMGMQRLYWIPRGFAAHEGAYVRYSLEEMCAILMIESHRFRARIVGENLGTVPVAVDRALLRHGIDDMYVLQYETNPEKGPTLRRVPATTVASVNTHDMPQFAAYWQELDVQDRLEMGLLSESEAEQERQRRQQLRQQLVAFLAEHGLLNAIDPTCEQVLEACQAFLAASDAGVVLVNLEDLWGETEPQNRPGTYREYPNWRRKARYSFEAFADMDSVGRILQTVDRLRRLPRNSSKTGV